MPFDLIIILHIFPNCQKSRQIFDYQMFIVILFRKKEKIKKDEK